MANRALEFHDSVILTIEQAPRGVRILLNGYVHSSEGNPGLDPGDGGSQEIEINLDCESRAPPRPLRTKLSSGEIVVDGNAVEDLLPLPFNARGEISLAMWSGSVLEDIFIETTAISVEPRGEARWVEAFLGSGRQTVDSNEWLGDLILQYIEASQSLARRLCQSFGVADLVTGRRDKRIPRTGTTPEGLAFSFHGIGCRMSDSILSVDFDFLPSDQLGGFDAWRLHLFADENRARFGRRSLEQVRAAFDEFRVAGRVVAVPQSKLFVMSEK